MLNALWHITYVINLTILVSFWQFLLQFENMYNVIEKNAN